jgi:hypothetical protein
MKYNPMSGPRTTVRGSQPEPPTPSPASGISASGIPKTEAPPGSTSAYGNSSSVIGGVGSSNPPGVGEIEDAPSFTGFLDDTLTGTGAIGIYSMRRSLAAYSGAAIRIRRASDDTEEDIGFDGVGDLDVASAATFIGASTGYITTWYDQSGNSRDLVALSQANQPVFSSSNTVWNSKPVLGDASTSIKFQNTSFPSIAVGTGFTIFAAYSAANEQTHFGWTATPSGNDGFVMYGNSSGAAYGHYWNDVDQGSDINLNGSISVANKNLVSVFHDTSDLNIFTNQSPSAQDTTSAGTNSSTQDTLSIGVNTRKGTLTGNFAELIIYSGNKTSERTDLETNISTYYDIADFQTPPATSLSPPLNVVDFDSIAVCYGMRKLHDSTTATNCIRLRRSSDNAELDYGFDANGLLDVGAIDTWGSGSTLYVVKWYDQGPEGYNVEQTSAPNQPTFSTTRFNGRPGICELGEITTWLVGEGGAGSEPNSIRISYRASMYGNFQYNNSNAGNNFMAKTIGAGAPDWTWSMGFGRRLAVYEGSGWRDGSVDSDVSGINEELIHMSMIWDGERINWYTGTEHYDSAVTTTGWDDVTNSALVFGSQDPSSGQNELAATYNAGYVFNEVHTDSIREAIADAEGDYLAINKGLKTIPICDQISTTAPNVAVSVRQLRKSYYGPCIRLRRSSDSLERDFGFDNSGNLLTGVIQEWKGDDDLYVTTIYDQSGNSRHLTQTNTSEQPIFTLIDANFNGKPSMSFDGDDNELRNNTDIVSVAKSAGEMYWAVARVTGTLNVQPGVFALTDGSSASPTAGFYLPSSSIYAWHASTNATMSGFPKPVKEIMIGYRTSTDLTVWAGGTEGNTTDISAQTERTENNFVIGSLGNSNYGMIGEITEVVHYATSNLGTYTNFDFTKTIEASTNSYFGMELSYTIPPSTVDFAYHAEMQMAFGTRKLFNGYTGNCMQITTDGVGFTEIPFDANGEADRTTISGIGGGTLRVSIWYDQSGNGRNAVPGTYTTGATVDTASSNLNSRVSLLPSGNCSMVVDPFPAYDPTNGLYANDVLYMDRITGTQFWEYANGGTATVRTLMDNSGELWTVLVSSGSKINWLQNDGHIFEQYIQGTEGVEGECFMNGDSVVKGVSQITATVNKFYMWGQPSGFWGTGATHRTEHLHYPINVPPTTRTLLRSNQATYYDVTLVEGSLSGTYPLDGLTGLSLACVYSMRRMLSSYSGPLIKLRKTYQFTDYTQDFSPDANGDLDQSAIEAWVLGTGDGAPADAEQSYVDTWYDQSGNGRDMTQSTTDNQPKFLVYDGLGLRPTIDPDGTKWLTSADVSIGISQSPGYTMFGSIRITTTSAANTLFRKEMSSGELAILMPGGTFVTSIISDTTILKSGDPITSMFDPQDLTQSTSINNTIGGFSVRQANPGVAVYGISFNRFGTAGNGQLGETLTDTASSKMVLFSGEEDSSSDGFAGRCSEFMINIGDSLPNYEYQLLRQNITDYYAGTFSSGIIDELGLTDALGLYSTRRLRLAYTGDCIRVRNDGSGAERDFGFNAFGELDREAISLWLDSDDGGIVTVYDQSGNGRHLTQNSASNQWEWSRRIDSGDITYVGSTQSVQGNYVNTNYLDIDLSAGFSVFSAVSIGAVPDSYYGWEGSSNEGAFRVRFNDKNTMNVTWNEVEVDRVVSTGDFPNYSMFQMHFIHKGTAGSQRLHIYHNEEELTFIDGSTQGVTASTFNIQRSFGPGFGSAPNWFFGDVWVFSGDKSASLESVESAFYSRYNTPRYSGARFLDLAGTTDLGGAFSTRQLLIGYTGNCFDLRRSSDDNESSFGFDSNGDLDTAAIESWAGNDVIYVKTWYDQSDNGNNLTQNTNGTQPELVLSNIAVGGKPSVAFNGSVPQRLAGTAVNPTTSTGVTVVLVTGLERINSDAGAWCLRETADSQLDSIYPYNTGGSNAADVFRYASNVISGGSVPPYMEVQTINHSGTNLTWYSNGTQNSTVGNTDDYVWDSLILGAITTSGGSSANCRISEFIYYDADRSTSRAGMESNIQTYFSLPYSIDTLVLDLLANEYAIVANRRATGGCYSTRLTRVFHNRPAFTLRRSSDNAESNFGFTTSGDLDTSAINTWLGGATAYVKTWFDQSGEENDATNSTNAEQPTLILSNSGFNSKPTVLFEGGQVLVAAAVNHDSSWTVRSVYQINGTGTIYNYTSGTGSLTNPSIHQRVSGGNRIAYADSSSLTDPINQVPFRAYDRTSNGLFAWYSNDALVDSISGPGNQTLDAFLIGAAQTDLTDAFNGHVVELFTSDYEFGTGTDNIVDPTITSYYSPSAVNFPLDNITATNADGVYSTRRLLTSYSGNCLKLRKPTGVTSDFGFLANGNLDTASIETWGGDDLLYVDTWYDQSGNSRDITQSTLGVRPRFSLAAGAFGGRPCIVFSAGQYLSGTTVDADRTSNSGVSLFCAWACEESDAVKTPFSLFQTSNDAIALYVDGSNDEKLQYEGTTLSDSTSAAPLVRVDTAIHDNTNVTWYGNKAQKAQSADSSTDLQNTFNVGSIDDSGTSPHLGAVAEVLYFNDDQGTDGRFIIENSMQAYYGLPVTTFTELIDTAPNTSGYGDGRTVRAAYSVRKLKTLSYNSYCFRLRRDSDDDEQNFGWDSNGDLDTTAIQSWLDADSATTAYVVLWYDQSGGMHDLAAPSPPGQQPVLTLSNGAFGGKPSVTYDGTQNLENNTIGNIGVDFTVWVVYKHDVVQSGGGVFSWNVSGNSTTGLGLFDWAPFTYTVRYEDAGNDIDTANPTVYPRASYDRISSSNGSAMTWTANGSLRGTGPILTETQTQNEIHLGNLGGTANMDGDICELIAFELDLDSTDNATIESSIESYYSLPWPELLLDSLSTTLVESTLFRGVYSLRRLRYAFFGNCIRLRRSTDDAESDFGFSSNVLDTSAISTWLGGATGYLITWYDQSGNGNDITAPTEAQQPVYVASKTEINNKPAFDFDSDYLYNPSFGDITNDSFVVWVVYNYASDTGSQGVFNWSDGDGGTVGGLAHFATSSSLARYENISAVSSANPSFPYTAYDRVESDGVNFTWVTNGVSQGSTPIGSGSKTQFNLRVGALGSGGGYNLVGFISELIIGNTPLDAGDTTTLDTDISTYYGL